MTRPLAVLVAMSLLAGTPGFAARAVDFVIDVPPHPETFVVRLRDPDQIAHARRILSGDETGAVHVLGKVKRKAARWNRPWHFVLVPKSVEFFELSIEVCDGWIAEVEEHLAEVGGAFLPGRTWCPWGSRLLREIERP